MKRLGARRLDSFSKEWHFLPQTMTQIAVTRPAASAPPGMVKIPAASYQPQGSRWYFPQTYRLEEHGKLLLMAPGKDRAGGRVLHALAQVAI